MWLLLQGPLGWAVHSWDASYHFVCWAPWWFSAIWISIHEQGKPVCVSSISRVCRAKEAKKSHGRDRWCFEPVVACEEHRITVPLPFLHSIQEHTYTDTIGCIWDLYSYGFKSLCQRYCNIGSYLFYIVLIIVLRMSFLGVLNHFEPHLYC